jgi:hypothetical protein
MAKFNRDGIESFGWARFVVGFALADCQSAKQQATSLRYVSNTFSSRLSD